MKKRELLERIEQLEREVAELKARPTGWPYPIIYPHVEPQQPYTQPYQTAPWWVSKTIGSATYNNGDPL